VARALLGEGFRGVTGRQAVASDVHFGAVAGAADGVRLAGHLRRREALADGTAGGTLREAAEVTSAAIGVCCAVATATTTTTSSSGYVRRAGAEEDER
jgi:hypothetical protein